MCHTVTKSVFRDWLTMSAMTLGGIVARWWTGLSPGREGEEDSLKTAPDETVGDLFGRMKMNIDDIPEGSVRAVRLSPSVCCAGPTFSHRANQEPRARFKRDFVKEMALVIAHLIAQKLDPEIAGKVKGLSEKSRTYASPPPPPIAQAPNLAPFLRVPQPIAKP